MEEPKKGIRLDLTMSEEDAIAAFKQYPALLSLIVNMGLMHDDLVKTTQSLCTQMQMVLSTPGIHLLPGMKKKEEQIAHELERVLETLSAANYTSQKIENFVRMKDKSTDTDAG